MRCVVDKLEPACLKVPFYMQRYEFTCGPASLMMAMKHHDSGFRLSTENEIDIWRESALAPLPPTIRHGLAFSALSRGFGVSILTNVKGVEYINKSALSSPLRKIGYEWLMDLALGMARERKSRALALGLKERVRNDIGIGDVRRMLAVGGVPIFLTSAKALDKKDEDWAHWAVITGIDDEKIWINNPALRKGRMALSINDFIEANGYHGDVVLISISKRAIGRKR